MYNYNLYHIMGRLRFLMLLFIAMLFISLFPAYAQGQDGEDTSFKKFGVGIGYGYRSLMMILDNKPMNDLCTNLHPMELSFQYRPDQRQIFYATIPWMLDTRSKIHNGYHDYIVTEHPNPCPYDNQKTYIYGLDIGYNYIVIDYKKFLFFAGIGIGFQRYKCESIHDTLFEENFPLFERDKLVSDIKTDAYSILPQAGIRYEWKRIGLELKYRFYITKKKYHFMADYYWQHPTPLQSDYSTDNTVCKHGISGSVFYYF